MNLKPVELKPDNPLLFLCKRCNRVADQRFETIYANIDGDPFVSYYCTACANKKMEGEK